MPGVQRAHRGHKRQWAIAASGSNFSDGVKNPHGIRVRWLRKNRKASTNLLQPFAREAIYVARPVQNPKYFDAARQWQIEYNVGPEIGERPGSDTLQLAAFAANGACSWHA
jgi:hypothetical protein